MATEISGSTTIKTWSNMRLNKTHLVGVKEVNLHSKPLLVLASDIRIAESKPVRFALVMPASKPANLKVLAYPATSQPFDLPIINEISHPTHYNELCNTWYLPLISN